MLNIGSRSRFVWLGDSMAMGRQTPWVDSEGEKEKLRYISAMSDVREG